MEIMMHLSSLCSLPTLNPTPSSVLWSLPTQASRAASSADHPVVSWQNGPASVAAPERCLELGRNGKSETKTGDFNKVKRKN